MSMFEFDEKTKLRSLRIFGFDVENLELDKVGHVPMHQYRIATKEKPMLYIENLQVCVALYAYSNNFGFAAHINPIIMRGDDFTIRNSSRKPIQFQRTNDLKRVILESYPIRGPIKIGLALGYCPISKNNQTIELIYDGIERLVYDLKFLGISIEELEDQSMPEFILDSTNQKIILPKRS